MASFDRIITATVKTTGEVIEYHVQTSGELAEAYSDIEAHIQAYRDLKSAAMNTSMEMIKQLDKKGDK